MSETETQTQAQPQAETQPQPTIIETPKRHIIVIGRKDGAEACAYCQKADQEISEKKAVKEGKVNYDFLDIESDEGEEELVEAGLSRRKGVHMPIIKDCPPATKEGEKPTCRVYEGYEYSDFADLDNWDP